MDEKQSPKRLGELLSTQTSLVKNSKGTLANRPTWITEILTRHGNFTQLCNKFSYANKNRFVSNVMDCFRRDSPSLVRIDVTYGRGSSANWLYNILQGMFVFLGVTEDKFSKEQVYNLACNIATNYKTLKVVEMLLFVSRFEAGRYGRFYGGDSYALIVTEAINTFMSERTRYYDEIERERIARKEKEESKNAISFEEYKRMTEETGGKVSEELNKIFNKKD